MSLLKFWEATRLRADDADTVEPSEQDLSATDRFRATLALVLGRGCGQRPGTVIGKYGTAVHARTTPSAGALYPFEVIVTVGDGSAYLYDVDTARLGRLHASDSVPPAELAEHAGLVTPAGRSVAALVVLVARPWKSMVKYGQRGYLYTHLDVGHAASNVAMSARAAGLAPIVHVRFHRTRLAEALALTGLCREPQLVVSLADPGVAGAAVNGSGGGVDGLAGSNGAAGLGRAPDPADPAGPADDVEWLEGGLRPVWNDGWRARLEPPGAEEQANWAELRDVGSLWAAETPPRLGRSSSIARPGGAARGAVPLPRSRPAGPAIGASDFTGVALRRRSAHGFVAGTLSRDRLRGLLDSLADPLDVDCADPDEPGVGVRLLVRAVDGVAPGVYAYSPTDHALHAVGGLGRAGDPATAPTDPAAADAVADDVVATCMGQAGLRHAAVLVHLHAPLRRLLRERGRAGLAEIHYHAARVAQSLCLAAARHDTGITCVGGFDEVRCAASTLLPEQDEVIYVLAVGAPDHGTRKLDRAAIAHSHGISSASRT